MNNSKIALFSTLGRLGLFFGGLFVLSLGWRKLAEDCSKSTLLAWLLRFLVVGPLIRNQQRLRFLQNLSLLLSAGIPAFEALEKATRGVSQLVRDAVDGLYDVFLETEEDAWQKVPRFKPLNEVEFAEVLDDLREVDLADSSLSQARDADYDRAVQRDWKAFLGTGLTKKISGGFSSSLRQDMTRYERQNAYVVLLGWQLVLPQKLCLLFAT